ncbi:proton-transporting V-type ATPase complex assembly regulator TMEM9-like [Oscarella lobularis]|uniref:proton-transporting V-type ATPase complex assembly regulator TMEM9-like n=1 Tax=Oscarella lobularis TaxID=121494 RepID=UPI0033140AA5
MSLGFGGVSVFGVLFAFNLVVSLSDARMRCRCICSRQLDLSQRYNKTVWVKTIENPSQCKCPEVVSVQNATDCLLCDCKYETLSVVFIEVIIIMILVGLGALVLYMIFLIVSECLGSKSLRTNPNGLAAKGWARIRSHQQHWREGVAEQRRNVYQRHTVLS